MEKRILVGFVYALCATAAMAQTFTTLVNFDGSNGAYPYYMAPVQGLDGNFYGTTERGGPSNVGTVFMMTPGGAVTTLYSFCAQPNCTDGQLAQAGLALGADGNFYGVTTYGGANNAGTVFKITPAGALTTLYSFCALPNCADGQDPSTAVLVQGTDGNFYGTTYLGGANNQGTVYKITPGGTLTTLYSFCSQPGCTDGSEPFYGLIQATNGSFYGTIFYGGANNVGAAFKITPAGKLTTLHSFALTEGYSPDSILLQASDGNFYGTAVYGGTGNAGTVYKMTPGGTVTTLYNFSGPDGNEPIGGLVQGTDGNIYGVTDQGGANGFGTVFELTLGGTLTTLHDFDGTDGNGPVGWLVQGTDGTFYGTTEVGGTNNNCAYGCGTVFSLSVGLGPFVEALPTFGKVGAAVTILGTNLTGATKVTINGAAAVFTVVSASEISATVPSGATTGKVRVKTPAGTLVSNLKFRVMPVISSFSPTSGPVGTVVTITGVSLTGATSVTFGGVKATVFTVNSDTQITATVPTGAVTGRITATTPGGTAASARKFTVT